MDAPRRATAAAAATLAAATLAGCSAGHTATNAAKLSATDVVIGTQGAPAGLDFTTIGGAAAPQALMQNVYETLVRIDDTGTPQPHLAESWEISDDGTVYTFHLREGVTFSDGTEFSAHTAAFSIDYVQTA